ncbi:MAG: fasciclin domain-containing protein [Prevotella sp.]|nr:fasciclin domain-containing protein [Prevotella sp.]
MKRNKYIGIAMMAAGMLAATSCTDFSDYNETPVDQMPSGDLTLWENISQNSQLSDFASLVRQSGYDAELNTPRSLTVWAPVNGTFNVSDFQGLSKEDLLNQFVKNHIAEYSHAATGKVEERVHMLNEKSFDFLGDGSYTFGKIGITSANLPSSNGLMHLLDGAAKFYPSIYEYLKVGEDIDSLRNHFMHYEETRLDENASVKGPYVDGIQTYIDSVMVTTNTLTRQLGALIEREDSSYAMLMPTNKAFLDMYNRVKPYYNFITTTKVNDVAEYASATDTKTKTVTVDAAYLTDSLVRRTIVNHLVYSNNNHYNKWILEKGTPGATDSLRSTLSDRNSKRDKFGDALNKFSNPKEILLDSQVGEPIEMSNGYGYMVDSLAFHPWESYCPELEFSPRSYLANLFPASAQSMSMSVPDSLYETVFGKDAAKKSTSYRYAWIQPGGDRAKPDFFIGMPGVMSTTYNFYVVFMPTALRAFGNEPRPNWLNFELNYCDAKGNTQKYCFSRAYADSLKTGGKLPAVPTSVNANTAFTNNPEKTDTVFIGRFQFPVCYDGIGSDYYPSIRVTSPISVFNSTQLATYSRDVRIAAFLLRPVELDEYEAKNK